MCGYLTYKMLSSRDSKLTPRWEKTFEYSILDPKKRGHRQHQHQRKRDAVMNSMTTRSMSRASEADLQDDLGSLRSGASTPKTTTSSVLINAAASGDVAVVRDVLEGTRVDPDSKHRYQERSALHLACGYGQLSVVEQLLQVILSGQIIVILNVMYSIF